MATYMSSSHPRYTVKSLLKEAESSPSSKRAPIAGQSCDHVVELQLIAAALNDLLPIVFWQQPLRNLLTYFDADDNIDVITGEQNRVKAAAVRRLIQRQSVADDMTYIAPIKERWARLKKNLDNFEGFKVKMDKILERI